MNTSASFEQDITSCLTVLQQGGLILYPTDTVWGIGCDATDEKAVERIYRLKNRNDAQALIILVADEREVLQYTAAPDLGVFDYLQTVQKPTTVIYEGGLGIAENLLSHDGSIAIRICGDEFCRHLIKRFKKPIVSTSANLSGEATPGVFKEIQPVIKNGVDYIVNHRQHDDTVTPSSSLIKWTNGVIEILRP